MDKKSDFLTFVTDSVIFVGLGIVAGITILLANNVISDIFHHSS